MSEMSIETFVQQLVHEAVREAVRAEMVSLGDQGKLRNASDAYLSVTKAARVADVAPGTIRAWIRAGRLDARRAGRVIRVSRAELERFMSGMPNKAQQAEVTRRAEQLLRGSGKVSRVI